jgi:hypothetical protein
LPVRCQPVHRGALTNCARRFPLRHVWLPASAVPRLCLGRLWLSRIELVASRSRPVEAASQAGANSSRPVTRRSAHARSSARAISEIWEPLRPMTRCPPRAVPVLGGRARLERATCCGVSRRRGPATLTEAGKPARRFPAASSVSVIRVDPTRPQAHQCAWHLSPTRIPTRRDGERSESTSCDGFPDRGSRARTASAGAARARQRKADGQVTARDSEPTLGDERFCGSRAIALSRNRRSCHVERTRSVLRK